MTVPPNCPGACCGPVNLYRQCLLVQAGPGGERQVVSWIPAEFAAPGRVVRLRERTGWEDGWVVRWAGKTKPGRDRLDSVLCECGA